jgi:hypothetical protein
VSVIMFDFRRAPERFRKEAAVKRLEPTVGTVK